MNNNLLYTVCKLHDYVLYQSVMYQSSLDIFKFTIYKTQLIFSFIVQLFLSS